MSRWSHLTDDELGARLADELRGEPATRIDEWVRGELRPAVRSRATARSQTVRTSPLAALAAASALVVVLALLIVAAPTLGPAAETASPASTPPSTWSSIGAAEFASRVAGGELRGGWYWVAAGIVPEVHDEPCPPPGPCGIGRLAGIEPSPTVYSRWLPTTENDTATEAEVDGVEWFWWELPPPPPPSATALILTVTDEGQIEYVGHQPEELFSYHLAHMPDIGSLEQSELMVVPGWLTAAGAGMERAGGPPPASVAGLPQRWSGAPAWVVDRPISLDPSGSVPPGDGVRVQNGAYEEFSQLVPGSDVTEPDAGLWAIAPRLEGAGCPDDAVPCWQWNLVARVSYDEPGPAEPVATPRVTPSPSAPDLPRTHECVGPPVPPGETPVPQSYPTVVDHTGLIRECALTDVLIDLTGRIRVSNVFEEDAVEVVWADGKCDDAIVFTFLTGADGYELAGERPQACPYDRDPLPVYIRFNQSVSGDQIRATLDGAPAEPLPTPTPAGPQPPALIGCPYENDPGAEPDVTVEDHLGLLRECETAAAPAFEGSASLGNVVGDPTRLVVEWSVPAYCERMPAELQLRPNTGEYAEDPYLLTVNVQTFNGPNGCRDAFTGQLVALVLSEAISADDVELVLMHDGRGFDAVDVGNDRYSIELAPERTEYVAGEPIELVAEFLYEGADERRTLSGYRAGLTYEQLDGDLLMEGAHSGECDQTSVRSGERRDVPLIGGWGASPDDPNYDFYLSWAESPYLWLPAGTWRVDVYVSFVVGPGCTGEQVRLHTTTILEVAEGDGAPTETPPPDATASPAVDIETADTGVGTFELALEADRSEYVAGEPIDLTATLIYFGPRESVSGASGHLLGPFLFEQLDGELEMKRYVTILPCGGPELRRNEPFEQLGTDWHGAFHVDDDDPDAAFYREWREGPSLWLPAGTWRVSVRPWLGGCDRNPFDVTASIVIRVVEGPPAEIALRTSPPNTTGVCRMAQGGGYLAPHPDTGAGVGDENGDNVRPIIWPHGFTARLEADGLVLYWADGRVLAREGNRLSFAGGTGNDGIFAACGMFEVTPQP